jgi:hypothetical protein
VNNNCIARGGFSDKEHLRRRRSSVGVAESALIFLAYARLARRYNSLSTVIWRWGYCRFQGRAAFFRHPLSALSVDIEGLRHSLLDTPARHWSSDLKTGIMSKKLSNDLTFGTRFT